MKSRSIIFSAPMMRAMLEGRKFVTRRLDKSWLKYKKGDEIWVRETWAPVDFMVRGYELDDPNCIGYRADGSAMVVGNCEKLDTYAWNWDLIKWRSSIFMPRWASRISHILTEDAREERLQDITEEEALMEGCKLYYDDPNRTDRRHPKYREAFITLWNSLHPEGKRWVDNPEVVRLCWK